MTRAPLVSDQNLDPIAKEVIDRFAARNSAAPDLYRLLANAPELLKGWTDFAWALRESPRTDRGLRELLIMRTALLTGAEYEWAHHWAWAIDSGVTEAQLGALAEWRAASCFSEAERTALALNDAVVSGQGVPDEVFQAAQVLFGPDQLIQLTLTSAFYVCVARLLGAFELPVEASHRDVPNMPQTSGT